jgi:xanthosine utilization system XapX-like protein
MPVTAPSSKRSQLWLIYLLFSAAARILDGVAQTLLLERQGVDAPVFALRAVIGMLLMLVYVPLAARLDSRRTIEIRGFAASGHASLGSRRLVA